MWSAGTGVTHPETAIHGLREAVLLKRRSPNLFLFCICIYPCASVAHSLFETTSWRVRCASVAHSVFEPRIDRVPSGSVAHHGLAGRIHGVGCVLTMCFHLVRGRKRAATQALPERELSPAGKESRKYKMRGDGHARVGFPRRFSSRFHWSGPRSQQSAPRSLGRDDAFCTRDIDGEPR
jgi:hypothetical protein